MKSFTTALAALIIAIALCAPAQARHHRYRHHHYRHYSYHYSYHHYRHYAHRGACDGFHRCRCGTTAARYFGIPYDYHGHNLKEARVWRQVFPHTSFHIGAAGVIEHHVLAITGGSNCANAMVHDDAGDYRRNVCHMTFVDVRGHIGRHVASY